MDFYTSSMGAMLGTLVAGPSGLSHAVLASVEGIPIAASPGLPTSRAEQLAAIGAGLMSIANGAGQAIDYGTPHHVMVEMSMGLMLTTLVGPRVGLTMLTDKGSDREQLGYEIRQFVDRVRPLANTVV